MSRTLSVSKSCDFFSDFCGSGGLKERLGAMISAGSFPHAVLLSAEAGMGRNHLARLIAAGYLGDRAGLVSGGRHPDCIVLSGEGASGEIRVDAVREAAYEMNKSAVTADGRRAVIIEDAENLNRSSSAVLLKTLEQPPDGVVFILTASSERDVIRTVVSRCARFSVEPPSEEACAAYLSGKQAGDISEIKALSELFRGRIGLVLCALREDDFRRMSAAAGRFSKAAAGGDRLMMLSALDEAGGRAELRTLLDISVFYFAKALRDGGGAAAERAVFEIERSRRDLLRNAAPKLFASVLVKRIATGA